MSYEENLGKLGLVLPDAPTPRGAYLPAVRAGDLLFLSGQLPLEGGKLAFSGKLGAELNVEQGQEACRKAVLNALAVIKQDLGSLERVERILRLEVYVASAPGFTQQPQVANGASELLAQVFGDAGRHARLAVGAAELPLNAPVEIALILAVRGGG